MMGFMSSEDLNKAQPKTLIQCGPVLRDCYGHAGSSRPKMMVLLHIMHDGFAHTMHIYVPKM